MTYAEAIKVLGLGPDEDPLGQMDRFAEARERMAKLVEEAPNETIGRAYQDALLEFEKAMERMKNGEGELEAEEETEIEESTEMEEELELETLPEIELQTEAALEVQPELELEAEPVLEVQPELELDDDEEEEPMEEMDLFGSGSAKRSSGGLILRYLLLFSLVGGLCGAWFFFYMEEEAERQRQIELVFLKGLGSKLVEGRRWDDASEAYLRIEELDPNSEVAEMGRLSIDFGREEEQQQFVGYWSGEALAAYEAGRLDDAMKAVAELLAKYPDEEESIELKGKIEEAKFAQLRQKWQAKLRLAIEGGDWASADAGLVLMGKELAGDSLIPELALELSQAKERERLRLAKAVELVDAARLRDRGVFDSLALEWVREAVALAPKDLEIRKFYEKLASYTRTLRVPEDVPTVEAALEGARDRDRIVMGEGSFVGGLVINKAVHLEGAGGGKTVVSEEAEKGPALTLGPGAEGAMISGITFRQDGFDAGMKRYPAGLVRGAGVEFSDCVFTEASGHGLMVIDGGKAVALRCAFVGNGWDGMAARGKGSQMTARECKSTGNFGHGYDVWDGALAVIEGGQAKGNSGNGVLVASAAAGLLITGGEFSGNREYGIVVDAGASGRIEGNHCRTNLLGGLVVRFAAISVVVEGNWLEKNKGAGLLLEQGLRQDVYSENSIRSNSGKQIVVGAKFER